MHTDHTLKLLDDETICIGAEFRKFNGKTCPEFDTQELKCEAEARDHRRAKKANKSPATSTSTYAARRLEAEGPLAKTFNLQTFKYHSLGDYADTIQKFGTTDSFSTEPVSKYLSVNFLGVDVNVLQGELEH